MRVPSRFSADFSFFSVFSIAWASSTKFLLALLVALLLLLQVTEFVVEVPDLSLCSLQVTWCLANSRSVP